MLRIENPDSKVKDERLTYDQAHGPFLAACKRAKITLATPDGTRQPGWHDLRQTFACWARRKGAFTIELLSLLEQSRSLSSVREDSEPEGLPGG
jgi:hypothetical protein